MTSTSRLAALVETMSNPNKTSGDESGSSSRGPEAKDERKVKRERKQVAAATSSSGAGYPTTAQAQARRAGRSPPTISRRARNQTQTRNQLSVSPKPSSANKPSPENPAQHLPPGPLRPSFIPRLVTRARVGPHKTPPNDRPDESHMPTPRASSQAGERHRPEGVTGRVLNLEGADAMTLKCRKILRDVSNTPTLAVAKSQIHYTDEDGMVSTLIEHMENDPIDVRAVDPSREYHESETKSIWTRLQTNMIEAISEVQFNLAYDKLDAMGFWQEVGGFTRQLAQVRHGQHEIRHMMYPAPTKLISLIYTIRFIGFATFDGVSLIRWTWRQSEASGESFQQDLAALRPKGLRTLHGEGSGCR
jgi:hypothetical protein